jgi:hypothetical protein
MMPHYRAPDVPKERTSDQRSAAARAGLIGFDIIGDILHSGPLHQLRVVADVLILTTAGMQKCKAH